jgi:tripartite-type tricarboxylate transporter receptor subunit TctC
MAFAQAAPPGSTLLHVTGTSSGPVHTWATRAPDGTTRVVLINLVTSGARTVAVRAGSASRPATLERLQAPSASATGDVTLGGQSFGPETSTGALTGRCKRRRSKIRAAATWYG